eukprot:gene4232-4651_t
MFLARIEQAQKTLSHEVHRIPKKSPILHELNEYLFDVFDANCMEDYHILESFEKRAMEAFDSPSPSHDDSESKTTSSTTNANRNPNEYTHEQYLLHEEFKTLFDSLIETFLQSKGYSSDDLYEELRKHYHNKKEVARHGEQAQEAEEVVDILAFYSDFPCWANMMKENELPTSSSSGRDVKSDKK